MNEPVITRRGDGESLNILGTRARFLCTAEQTGKAWSLMEVVLPRHTGAPLHAHPWDEAYYVVSGEVKFVVGEDEHLVRAGDFLHAPADTLHAFEGHSDDAARVIIFDAPAHAAGFFRDVDAQVRTMPDDLGKMLDIGARHQVRFAQPC